jgi:hypothetical protein
MPSKCPCLDESVDPCPRCGATVSGNDAVNGICQADFIDKGIADAITTLAAERDQMKEALRVVMNEQIGLTAERDAAIARAEAAEKMLRVHEHALADQLQNVAKHRAEVERLRKAIEPFLAYAREYRDDESDTTKMPVRIGDLRRARAALERQP